MAKKKIQDFPTLPEAQATDLVLVGANDDTYNMPVGAITAAAKEAATEDTNKAVTASQASQAASEASKVAAESARDAAEEAQAAAEKSAEEAGKAQIDPDDLGLEQDEETGLVYPTYKGVRSENGIPLAATGGGGGGGSGGGLDYTISLKNELESRTIVVPDGAAAELKFRYSSVDEDGYDDGAGVGTVLIDTVKVATVNVQQGSNTVDVADYLTAGEHQVKIKVSNSEGSTKSLTYTVTLISLSMGTTMDAMGTYSGSVVFYYTPVGTGNKTIHFLMDGVEIGNEVVASSGKSRSFIIPEQEAGGHLFTSYAELTMDGTVVKSNTITLGMLWVSDSMSEPAILSTFTQETAVQGENLTIPHMVYDPQSETTTVTYTILNADKSVYSTKNLTVDRTVQEWVVQDYPIGNVVFRITCGAASKDFTVAVSESSVDVKPITDSLAFLFDPTGRSNLEDDPAAWSDGSVTATFEGVGFTGADGWLTDADGASLLRILPGGEVSIPFKIFETDARNAGATIEVEMATHNVRDYDTVVMSCLSGNRGFKIASQYAQIRSEQSEVSMQFKEDTKVRVSFVVEPKNLHRLIYVFVDGIMCGAVQYPTSDNFAQSPPVGITIGADSSGIDLYRIRVYTKGLTRHEVLDNYIADRPTLAERVNASKRNDIFDISDNIVVSKLPATLPYMIIKCAALPQYKGDKKTCQIEYVNPADTARSFTAVDAEIDVQGTSSVGYKKKNFKIKLKNGITYTVSLEKTEEYKLREDSIPASVFCMKADVASSEGANNVELVRLYNDTVPYKTPAQETDSRVRVGIDGLPCIIFWQNSSTNELRFHGKYNFNFDKSAEKVFGLQSGCESWEVRNNTSNRVTFKSADFSGTAWQEDFEARYPDGNTDCTKLKALCEWIVSTDRSAVETEEEKAARLQKFKNEFEQHFVKTPMLFYYLFTETFLMVDSRAKNFFPTTYDGVHWLPLPYDFDTALGINNEGQLVFDYDLEDTDTVSGDVVFNGQESTLWCNIRDAFADELKAMYNSLRNITDTEFDSTKVVKRFAEHQAVWPEAVWNEDSWEKYLEPLENDNNSSYLTMLQGDKSSQREWWTFNGFRYRDSKYQCGDAEKNFITLRCYAVGNITVTPYSHIYPRIKYGSYTVTERGKRNVPTTLTCPLDTMSDTEVYVYSADRLASIGDLSAMQVGYADFSMATKLQSLKLGDGAESYQNTRLTELYVGNNELLTTLDVRNCASLAMTVNLSGCVGIETIRAKGTAVTGFTLPTGAKLKTLELPDTVTNLTLRDLALFTTLDTDGFGELTTLRVENTPNVALETIINGAPKLNRVRLIGMEWDAESEETLQATITKLKSCIGMDAAGDNTASAVVTGRVYVPSISADLLTEINDAFPQLVVVANGVPQYVVRYLDWDNTVLYRAVVAEGADTVDAVAAGYISAPTRTGTEDTGYKFKDFGTLATNVHSNVTLVAQYQITYRVRFLNEGAVYNTQWVVAGSSATKPSGTPTKASTAQYTYTFSYWSGSYTDVTAPVDVRAVYSSTIRKYTVYFYNGTTLLQTVADVPYGGSASYTGDTPVDPDGKGAEFKGWNPSPTNITGTTTCYAQFRTPWVDPTDDVSGAYAVQWNYAETSTALARGGLAASFGAPQPATALDGVGSSPFDGIMPWAGMKKYNIIDGAVSYSEDDAGFSETDYDTVVYIPEFYYYAEKDTDNERWTWAISPTQLTGFKKHPGSGRYIGRFHSSGSSAAIYSKSGVTPLAIVSITNFNTYSHNKGEKWYQMDVAVWSALQMLYLVEFADFNSQSKLGNGQNTGSVKATGSTTGASYHTLKLSSASNQYRWVENPFSNLCTWLAGFYSSSRSVYLTEADTTLSVTTSGKTDSGIDLPSSNGCISGFGFSDDFSWAFIPDTSTGTDYTKYAADRVGSLSSYPIALVGGYYDSYAGYGFFYLNANYDASGTNSSIGSRLLYIP